MITINSLTKRYGATLAVGMPLDDSLARGVNSDHDDEGSTDSGAVYVFVRRGSG